MSPTKKELSTLKKKMRMRMARSSEYRFILLLFFNVIKTVRHGTAGQGTSAVAAAIAATCIFYSSRRIRDVKADDGRMGRLSSSSYKLPSYVINSPAASRLFTQPLLCCARPSLET